jgi:hypothetical protein
MEKVGKVIRHVFDGTIDLGEVISKGCRLKI